MNNNGSYSYMINPMTDRPSGIGDICCSLD